MEKLQPRIGDNGDIWLCDEGNHTVAIVPLTDPNQKQHALLLQNAPRLLSGLILCARALKSPSRVRAYEDLLLEQVDLLLAEIGEEK